MVNPRVVLNKLKWAEGFIFKNVKVYYVHRGATDDTKIISGEDIVSLDKGFICLNEGGMIPYHRVFKIVYKHDVVFQRKSKKA